MDDQFSEDQLFKNPNIETEISGAGRPRKIPDYAVFIILAAGLSLFVWQAQSFRSRDTFLPPINTPQQSSTPVPTSIPSQSPISSFITDPSNSVTPSPANTVCIQVITRARKSDTGEERDFPTPCDVPEGWLKID